MICVLLVAELNTLNGKISTMTSDQISVRKGKCYKKEQQHIVSINKRIILALLQFFWNVKSTYYSLLYSVIGFFATTLLEVKKAYSFVPADRPDQTRHPEQYSDE